MNLLRHTLLNTTAFAGNPLLCSMVAEGEEPQVSISQEDIPVERTTGPVDDPKKPEEEAQETALPEGYDNWEAYGKAVAEGKAKPPEAKTTEEAPKVEDKPAPTAEETKAAAEFDAKLAPYTTEVLEKGDLSPESIAKAAKDFGVTEDMVKVYLEGQKAQGATFNAPLVEAVGGDWGKFNEWATANLDAEKQATLNKALQGDRAVALEALRTYAEQFKNDGKANPPGSLTRGAGGGSVASDVYESDAQQLADQRSPLYRTDPAFRAKVEAKIGRTMKAKS